MQMQCSHYHPTIDQVMEAERPSLKPSIYNIYQNLATLKSNGIDESEEMVQLHWIRPGIDDINEAVKGTKGTSTSSSILEKAEKWMFPEIKLNIEDVASSLSLEAYQDILSSDTSGGEVTPNPVDGDGDEMQPTSDKSCWYPIISQYLEKGQNWDTMRSIYYNQSTVSREDQSILSVLEKNPDFILNQLTEQDWINGIWLNHPEVIDQSSRSNPGRLIITASSMSQLIQQWGQHSRGVLPLAYSILQVIVPVLINDADFSLLVTTLAQTVSRHQDAKTFRSRLLQLSWIYQHSSVVLEFIQAFHFAVHL